LKETERKGKIYCNRGENRGKKVASGVNLRKEKNVGLKEGEGEIWFSNHDLDPCSGQWARCSSHAQHID
jgi:hypothetical protein